MARGLLDAPCGPPRRTVTSMGFLDALLGRTKPKQANLDQLFGIPSAAVTLQVAAEFRPTGVGSVCFKAAEGGAFARTEAEIKELLETSSATATSEPAAAPIEVSEDSYGYTWLIVRRQPDDIAALVTDLHAVNVSSGVAPAGHAAVLARDLQGSGESLTWSGRSLQARHLLSVRATVGRET